MDIELTKKSYNVFKLWGLINLLFGLLALGFGYFNHSFLGLCLAAVGLICGGIQLTISKGPLVSVTHIRLPIRPNDTEKK